MSHVTWVHKAARWCVRPLVSTRVTPNHITTVRLLTGLAAAVAFAVGEQEWTFGEFILRALVWKKVLGLHVLGRGPQIRYGKRPR